jgi:hypothetical protein
MREQTPKPGTFLRIPLADGSFGYGRALELLYGAFYNYRTTSPDSDLDRIASKPVLFKIAVRHLALKAWEVIGWKELEEYMTQPVVFYHQDVSDFRRCTIWDSAGKERAAEPQECVGLESDAVWEQHHVEERLLDAFMDRPNATAEYLRVRLR